MRRSKFILVLLISFSFWTNELHSQVSFRPGYIVNVEGDTIRGQLKYGRNKTSYHSCIFRTSDEKIVYTASEIQSYGFDNGMRFISNSYLFFDSLFVNQFLKILVKGKMSLYQGAEKYFLVEKDTSKFLLTDNTKEVSIYNGYGYDIYRQPLIYWREPLNQIFRNANCEVTYTKKMPLTSKQITKAVIEYNKCTDSEYVEIMEDLGHSTFLLGLQGSLSTTRVRDKDPSGYPGYGSFNISGESFGVTLGLINPRINDKIAISTGIIYSSSYKSNSDIGFSNRYKESSQDPRPEYEGRALKSLFLPLNLTYFFQTDNLDFYLKGGIVLRHNIADRLFLKPEGYPFPFARSYIDAFDLETDLGVGVSKMIKNYRMNFGFNYRQSITPLFTSLVVSYPMTFSLDLSVMRVFTK